MLYFDERSINSVSSDSDKSNDSSFHGHGKKSTRKPLHTAQPKTKAIKKTLNMSSKSKSTRSHQKRKTTSSKPFNALSKSFITSKPIASVSEKFYCDKCGETFPSGWALGGHASRVHPGESLNYKNKLMTREAREVERKLLALAKQMHIKMFGERVPINRVKIRKFKKELREKYSGQRGQEELRKIDV